MSHYIFVLFVVMAVFAASSNGQCGTNEEFKSCGSACEPACGDTGPRGCTMQCVIACQCKPGFLRKQPGVCVTPEECSNGQQCGVNEEFKSCGTACEPTCTEPNPHACTKQCVIGCQCKPGFLRKQARVCVTPQECSNGQECGMNEEFRTCGTACEENCILPRQETCTKICVIGCQCKTEYLRNAEGVCVTLQECEPDA